MSGEKKQWRLSAPFRRFSPKHDDPPTVKVGRSGSRVSSVYLSDDSSESGFVIVPEFDYPVATPTTFEQPVHGSRTRPSLPTGPLSPSVLDGDTTNIERINPRCSYHTEGFFRGREDDLAQRLSVAYDRIRSMPSAASPKTPLSPDPRTLRKQLGVPQHSVFNYPIYSLPDLPNPHPSALEPPYAISPDMSLITASKFGLRINMHTDVYPPHSPKHSQETTQSAQNKPSVATLDFTECSLPQCSTFETPWRTRFSCMSKSPDSISDPSKLAKCRTEKMSLPSSSCKTSRGVLRKPSARSPMNTYKRQISLPQIRPPSPFEINIPLHHAWHDRRTDFSSSTKFHSDRIHHHDKNSRRASGSTEVLASLAWIGTSHAANGRRYSEGPDHFDMGIAVEDDSISDDDLVDRLEKARGINVPLERVSPSGSSSDAHFSSSRGGTNTLSPMPCSPCSLPTSDQLPEPCDIRLSSSPISKNSDLEDAAVWRAARKALLCIREIVRTEKKYQEALKMLLNAQTTTPPPPSMSPYVLALVHVSEMLLKRFLEDPSAWGVSTAFVTSEDELEASMVSWCAVAGAFFTDENNPQSSGSTGRWRLRKSGMAASSSPSSVTKQTLVSPTPQLPPVLSMTNTAGMAKERLMDEHCTGQRPPTKANATLQKQERAPAQLRCRKLSVRDLAIQPIQRVMRYVLLYRDLLDCIPVMSPPRLLVERALEAATRIANQCDRAQRNPAFCHAP